MNYIDYIIIGFYLVGFLSLGYFFKDNKNSSDYFLGGRSMGWFPLSLSTMATQLSAISFISAPAFVGLKANGGLKWLTFELAVPLAMLFILLAIFPPLFRSGVISIYEFVERRFDRTTRIILSIVFQISRALGTGVMVYTIAFILQAVLGISFVLTILLISVITIIYSWQGGMKAVVWGDALQMLLLFVGLFMCLVYGYMELVDVGGSIASFDESRLQVIDFNWGVGDGEEYGLLPMLFGGFFLYASYYGCDQTQAQRMLSAKSEKTVKQLLMVNGLFRFPVVLVYCVMGLILGALVYKSPEFLNEIKNITELHFPEEFAANGIKPDLMVPVFILKYLPHGVIGVLIVAILSAAMSSLSSTINSLSAVSVEDFFQSKTNVLSDTRYLWISKLSVVFWGGVCIAAAFLFGGSNSPVIEIINAIGSVFYGPVLATFVLAIFSKKVNQHGMKAGIIGAVLINLLLSSTMQDILGFDTGITIFWMWLNFTGFFMAVGIAYVVSLFKPEAIHSAVAIDYQISTRDFFQKEGLVLMGFFILILAFCFLAPYIF